MPERGAAPGRAGLRPGRSGDLRSATIHPGLEQAGQERGAAPELIPGRRAHRSSSAVSRAGVWPGKSWSEFGMWVSQLLGIMLCPTKIVRSLAPRGCGSPFSELPPLSDESCSGRQAPAGRGAASP